MPSEYVTIVADADNTAIPSAPPMPTYGAPSAAPAVVTTTTIQYHAKDLGRGSVQTQCPVCNQLVTTRVTDKATGATWCAAVSLLIVFWPICWLPFVVQGCKETEHKCVQCNNILGRTQACA